MLVKNALRVLAPHAKMRVDGHRYQAVIRETTIEFNDVGGQVANLRCRRGEKSWRPKCMTHAIRMGLNGFKHLPGPKGLNLLLNVGIDHRGSRFEPVACFVLMAFEPVQGASAEYRDEEALGMAEGVIGGQRAAEELLDWLTGRGGEVAAVVERVRPNHYELCPEDFVCVWTRSNSADEATRRMSRLALRGLLRRAVVARASRYRRHGVRLKIMTSSGLGR